MTARPDIADCARKLAVPKKKVKLTVRKAPPNKTIQTMPGTMPVAATRRSRRAALNWSRLRRISAITTPSSAETAWNLSTAW
jgi:hypothetical protein